MRGRSLGVHGHRAIHRAIIKKLLTMNAQLWYKIRVSSFHTGDWSNGMIGVSKTFGGSSILSSPVSEKLRNALCMGFLSIFFRYCLVPVKNGRT